MTSIDGISNNPTAQAASAAPFASRITDIYNSKKNITTFEELLQATKTTQRGIHLALEEEIDTFIRKVPHHLSALVYEQGIKVTDKEWTTFDHSFSAIINSVIKRGLTPQAAQEHLKRILAIESIAQQQLKQIDPQLKPVVLTFGWKENSSLEEENVDQEKAVIIAKSVLLKSPMYKAMFDAPSIEANKHTIDLTDSAKSAETFEIIVAFLKGEPDYEKNISLQNVADLLHFAEPRGFSDLSQSCARYMLSRMPTGPNDTLEQLSSEVRSALEIFIRLYEVTVRKPEGAEEALLTRYLTLKLGKLSNDTDKYIAEIKALQKNKQEQSTLYQFIIDFVVKSIAQHYGADSTWCPYDIAEFYNLIDDWIHTKTYLLQHIELDSYNAVAYRKLGFACNKLKQFDEAKTHLTKAIQLDPQEATAYINLGFACNELKQFDEAKIHLTKAIQLDPREANAYKHLGSMYIELKQFEEAKTHLEKALELKPDYAEAKALLDQLPVTTI